MPEQKSAAPAVHPLLSREIRPLYNWHEWLARWDAALTAEELLGLLHVGFNVPLDRSEHGEKGYDAVDLADHLLITQTLELLSSCR